MDLGNHRSSLSKYIYTYICVRIVCPSKGRYVNVVGICLNYNLFVAVKDSV